MVFLQKNYENRGMFWRSLFFLLSSFFLFNSEALECRAFLANKPQVLQGKIIRGKDSEAFEVTERARIGNKEVVFKFSAYLDFKGVATFNITLKAGGYRSSMRGNKLFQEALMHFGNKVKVIRGRWVEGDNLNAFEALSNRGFSDEDAAFGTWTGQQALKAGFTKIDSVSAVKMFDHYNAVVIDFIKP